MSYTYLLGIVAGLLSVSAYPIYIRDIYRGETRPSKVTWWILALLNIVLTASYYASGARSTIWIPVSYSIGFTIIAVLSITKGEGSWEKTDYLCLLGAVLTLLLWWRYQSAELALYFILVTDFIGLSPTMYKSYKRPWTESKQSWSIALFASAINIVAIDTWTLAVALYPFYLLVTNAVITGFILFPIHKNLEVLNTSPV